MMGASTLGTPETNKTINGTKKTITDFFSKSPHNSPTGENKPKNLLGYFSKCSSQSPSNGIKTNDADDVPQSGSPVLQDNKHSANNSNVVKNASSGNGPLSLKRKRVSKELLSSGDDFVKVSKPKRHKSAKATSLIEEDPDIVPLSPDGTLSEKPLKTSVTKSLKTTLEKTVIKVDKILGQDGSVSMLNSEDVKGGKNKKKLANRRGGKRKNSKISLNSCSGKNDENSKSHKENSVRKSLAKPKRLTDDSSFVINGSRKSCDRVESSSSCNDDINEEKKSDCKVPGHTPSNGEVLANKKSSEGVKSLKPSSGTNGDKKTKLIVNTTSELIECKSISGKSPVSEDKSQLDSMELSYEEYLLSETVDESQTSGEDTKQDSLPITPAVSSEKVTPPPPTKSNSIANFFSLKRDNTDSQKVTVVADIHPEPSSNSLATNHKVNTNKAAAETILKNIPSEVIKSKHREINDIVVLSTELLEVGSKSPMPSETRGRLTKKGTALTTDRGSKKATRDKNRDSNITSENKVTKNSQPTLSFGQHGLEMSSRTNDTGTISSLSEGVNVLSAKVSSLEESSSPTDENNTPIIKPKRGRPRKYPYDPVTGKAIKPKKKRVRKRKEAKVDPGDAVGAEHASGDAVGAKHASADAVGAKHASGDVVGTKHASGDAVGAKHDSGDAVGAEHASGDAVGAEHDSGDAVGAEHDSGDAVGAEHDSGDAVVAEHASGDAVGAEHASGDAVGAEHASGDAVGAEHASGDAVGAEHASGDAVGAEHASGDAVGAEHASGDAVGAEHDSGDAVGAEHDSGDAVGAKHDSGDAVGAKHDSGDAVGAEHASGDAVGAKHQSNYPVPSMEIEGDPPVSDSHKSVEILDQPSTPVHTKKGDSDSPILLSESPGTEDSSLQQTTLSTTRKSRRLRQRQSAPPPFELVEDISPPPKVRKKKKKAECKPALAAEPKSSKNKEISKKQDGKLAPIFLKKSSKDDVNVICEVDTEASKLRCDFLMSGLPEEAKRQQQQTSSIVSVGVGEYTPFPRDIHIQQIELRITEGDNNLDVWNLPEAELPSMSPALPEQPPVIPTWTSSSALVLPSTKTEPGITCIKILDQPSTPVHTQKDDSDSPILFSESPGTEDSSLQQTTLSTTRKSRRLRQRQSAPPPFELVEDISPPPKVRKEKKKAECKPALAAEPKSSKNKEISKKQDGKLAPIFIKKSSKDDVKVICEVDTEASKLRRAFLMSGLPEEAKRQQQQASSIVSVGVGEYTPFPRDIHIQQIELGITEGDNNLDVWNLPEAELPSMSPALPEQPPVIPTWTSSSALVLPSTKTEPGITCIKKFSGHSPLSQMEVNTILDELATANPAYPVRRFYEIAVKRAMADLKTDKDGVDNKPEKAAAAGGTVDSKQNGGAVEEEEPKGKRKKSRSLGRKRSNKSSEVSHQAECQKSKKVDNTPEEKGCDILWTEKYQPQQSVEIISNSAHVKKLKSWLLEWKQRTDREARKLKKLLLKQKKNKKSKGEDSSSTSSWMDDDSDFELSPSESDEDSLCNTTILTGPRGVGKTSAIYALAMELGYQVFEVNASSARSGKKILTQLQEATQSHQVTKDKTESAVAAATPGNTQLPAEVPKTSNDRSVPSSFSSFFKSSNNVKTAANKSVVVIDGNEEEGTKEVCSRKRKQNNKKDAGKHDSTKVKKGANKKVSGPGLFKKVVLGDVNSTCPLDASDKAASNRLNLSSTSLILFDEVDVVFEEDKGFWSAIQHFMTSTKRPIILTATSPDFHEYFSGFCEHLHLRIPSTKNITSHLQTLCLAENVVTKASEISDMVTFYNGDMRSCLLTLQFWVDSGGAGCPVNIPLSLIGHEDPVLTGESKVTDINTGDEVAEISQKKQLMSEKVEAETQTFPAHLHSLESCLALDPHQLKIFHPENLSKKSPSDSIDWQSVSQTCKHCYQQHFSLCHQMLPSGLSLPRRTFPLLSKGLQRTNTVPKCVAPVIIPKLNSDLYDSEVSCDSPTDQMAPSDSPDTSFQAENSSKEFTTDTTAIVAVKELAEAECSESQSENIGLTPELTARQRRCETKILSAMAEFYDSCSATDAMLTCCSHLPPRGSDSSTSGSGSQRWSLSAGLWDEFPMDDKKCSSSWPLSEHCFDIGANVELRSYLKCQQSVARTAEMVVDGQEHRISISTQPRLSGLVNTQSQDRSVSLARQRAVENVLGTLPAGYGHQQVPLYLDYLPTLRNICRTEKTRQLAKLKRRFFHYFDNISLPLRDSTLAVLGSDFT